MDFFAPHLQRLLAFAAAAHHLTHRAGPLPLSASEHLALCQARAGLYQELFDASAPTDEEEVMLVLSLLPTLLALTQELEQLSRSAPGLQSAEARHARQQLLANITAVKGRLGITAAQVAGWITCRPAALVERPAELLAELPTELLAAA